MMAGDTLFGDWAMEPPAVPGLVVVEDVVGETTARELSAAIDTMPLEPFKFGQWRGKRMTCSFGSGYDYAKGRLTAAPAIPGALLAVRPAVVGAVDRDPRRFEHVLAIRYDPGAGIGWHRDRPQYDEIVGLSLDAPATLRLRRRFGSGFERRAVWLAPRSVYLLSGPVRDAWEHSILPMETTRRSITFRSLRTA